MTDKLTSLIYKLKQANIIKSQPNYIETLSAIEKFADNNFKKAYLLGYFFKNTLNPDKLSIDDKNYLFDTIKKNNLENYFYLKSKPETDSFPKYIFIFIIIGIISIIKGTIELIDGDFWYGLGTMHLVPIIREGGYKIILGLILLIGGLIRLKYENKKRRFIKSLLTSKNK